MRTEDVRKLGDRVKDHLLAQGFRDDMLYVHVAETYDNKILVTLYPFTYDCPACRAKGFVPRLADAFKEMLRPTWCESCMDLTRLRWDRRDELMPRLVRLLETDFTVAPLSPGNPYSSILITG